PSKPLKLRGASHFPSPLTAAGAHVRCRCRKGSSRDLTQDLVLEELPPPALPLSRAPQSQSGPAGMSMSTRTNLSIPGGNIIPGVKKATTKEHLHLPEDGYGGIIISLGPRTDAIIDRYQLSDKELIPAIRVLSRAARNSSWEMALQAANFHLSYEQARNLSRAMHGDLGVPYGEVLGFDRE
ncbi:hypothetical protein DXG01_012236, partial [Tephrocybe rancida]